MNCYNCHRSTLGPVLLDPGLPAKACVECGGVHIDLLTYRSWRDDGYMELIPPDLLEVALASENHVALICQGCAKLMLKFRISSEHDNFVDVCTHCNTVWLDSGEWG